MESVQESAPSLRLTTADILLLWTVLPLWLLTFLFGILVDSSPFRSRLVAFTSTPAEFVRDVFVAFGTYTLTNVALLCLFAALLGCLANKAGLGPSSEDAAQADTTAPRRSAILRGFFVYLAFIAGVLVIADAPASPTQVQYAKIAGAVSLVGFVVNYRPALFAQLLKSAAGLLEQPPGPKK